MQIFKDESIYKNTNAIISCYIKPVVQLVLGQKILFMQSLYRLFIKLNNNFKKKIRFFIKHKIKGSGHFFASRSSPAFSSRTILRVGNNRSNRK